jgi:hypothetical protein
VFGFWRTSQALCVETALWTGLSSDLWSVPDVDLENGHVGFDSPDLHSSWCSKVLWRRLAEFRDWYSSLQRDWTCP